VSKRNVSTLCRRPSGPCLISHCRYTEGACPRPYCVLALSDEWVTHCKTQTRFEGYAYSRNSALRDQVGLLGSKSIAHAVRNVRPVECKQSCTDLECLQGRDAAAGVLGTGQFVPKPTHR
jgi:hypothetical protein